MSKGLKNLNRVILTSKDYSLLHFSIKNRPIKKQHVAKMQESVKKHGCLRLVIVVWDDKLEKYVVVDGQHLSHALMGLNRVIECQVVKCKNDAELTQLMIDLNNTSKSWLPNDYIHNWAESGKEDYSYIRNVIAKNIMQLTVILMAYSQKKRLVATKEMKDGTLNIVNKRYGDKLITQIRDCNNFLPSTRAVNEALIQLMLNVEKYDHKKMLKHLKSSVKHTKLETNETKLYNQLLEIYNNK
jgi:hypothetical protein